MDVELLGWPADGPTLDLDHERFAYAGKFVMSSTGKVVARDGDELVGAVAFNADRTDDGTCWLRYVTVRRDRQGEGIGPRLLAVAREAVVDGGYERVTIAVNNPLAYDASYRAGFRFTGEETGIAELVLAWSPGDGDAGASYEAGLRRFAERDLDDAGRAVVDRGLERGPPAPLARQGGADRPEEGGDRPDEADDGEHR